MQTLEQFISENRNTALIVIRKSPWHNQLDHMEIEEIIHMSLWAVFQKFSPEKSSLGRFINIVVSRYLLRLIRTKMRWKSREVELGEIGYQPEPNPQEWFTETEWATVEPIYHNHSLKEAAEMRGFEPCHYRVLTKSLAHFRGEK